MSDQEIPESSPKLVNSKRGRLIVIVLVAVIALGGVGFFYYSGIQTAKRTFAEKCIVIIPKIYNSFSDYSDYKNQPEDDIADSGSAYFLALKNSLSSLSAAAKENSKYSGAKKTLEALDSYNSDLNSFAQIKGKELKMQFENPHTSRVRVMYLLFIRQLQTDPFSSQVDYYKNEALKAEKLWESYMARNFTLKDHREMNAAALKVQNSEDGLLKPCRDARE